MTPTGRLRRDAVRRVVTGSRVPAASLVVVVVALAAPPGAVRPAPGTAAPSARRHAPRRVTRVSRAEGPGHTSWSGPVVVEHGASLDSVSCVSRDFCVALDASGAVYHFDGSTWSGPTHLLSRLSGAPTTGRSEVDCVSRSFCMAIAGGAGAYLDTGGLWRPLPAPPGAEPLQAISCSGATFCAAIDGIGDAYVFDGRSWSGALNGWGAPSSLSCVSATSCVAVGVGASSWNGQGWTKPTPVDPRGLLSAVSCSQASQCVAVDDEGNALALDDGRWSAPRAVTGEGVTGRQGANLTSISCVPGGECTAVGSRGIVVRSIEAAGSAAARWARPVSLGDRADLRGVSCVAGGFCLAVDAAGDAFVER